MKNWIEPALVEVPSALQSAVGGNRLVLETLVRRGLVDVHAAAAYLNPDRYIPDSPLAMPDMQAAVERIEQAIRDRERLCVWGDFDVDGQTATTLLVSALRDLGANLTYHIPVRASESHGVNIPVLKTLLDQGCSLLLTCDTGITAFEAVEYANQRGVDVLITDHHELARQDGTPRLPPALVAINPKRLPAGHSLENLPGVGVAYKLVEALYQRLGREAGCEQYLDLVALGVVADVALQRGDTRYLLQRGLEVLRQNRRPGLQEMLILANLNPDWLSEEHIGFIIGPRLNALGRLSDANSSVEFLTTRDAGRARILALELEGLNAQRKMLTDQVFQGALAQLEADSALLQEAALVLAHPAWPAGVIGIVASRLVERYHKPVVLLAAPVGKPGRGSARSIESVDITAAIAEQADLLEGFGGHPMAAGLSILPERISEFRKALSRSIRQQVGELPPQPPLQIDGYLDLGSLSLDLVEDLERLAPFGAGNPPLVLASRGLRLASQSSLGKRDEHLLLTVADEGDVTQRVFWWQGAGWSLPQGKFDLAYSVRASTYKGQRQVQVEWIDAREAEEQSIEIQVQRRQPQIIDVRVAPEPLAYLQSLRKQGPLQIWCEPKNPEVPDGKNRSELLPGEALVVWSIPPGRTELQQVLARVSPAMVYLFAADPRMDSPEAFLQRLAGLVKYTLTNRQGHSSLSALAGATAQRPSVVRMGLAWLQANGHLTITQIGPDELQLAAGSGESGDSAVAAEQLKQMLDETAAFRAYYQRAEPGNLCDF